MGAPFFIVGASRSGTTMLRLMLNAHRNICVPGELSYFERCAKAGLLDRWARPALLREEFLQFVTAFLHEKSRAFGGINLEYLADAIAEGDSFDLKYPFIMAMNAWSAHQGKGTWGEKTPKNIFYIDVIHEMFPEARFLFLIRDPRAVVHSMNRFARLEDNSAINAFNWVQAVTAGRSLLQSKVPSSQWLAVRYEALVQRTESELRRICSFLEEPYDEHMLGFYHSSTEVVHPHSEQLGGAKTLSKPVSTVSLNKWRREMDDVDIATVEYICRDHMGALQYEPIGYTLPLLRSIRVWLTLYYCRWQRSRNKNIRSYQIAFTPLKKSRQRVGRLLRRVAS